MTSEAKTVFEYLSSQPEERRGVLSRLRGPALRGPALRGPAGLKQRCGGFPAVAAALLPVVLLAALLLGCRGLPRPLETTEPVLSSWRGFSQSSFRLRGSGGESIPLLLLLPASEQPCPAVLALHGLSESKEAWLELDGYSRGGNVTLSLLQRGFAVIAPDLPLHGERSEQVEETDWQQLVLRRWGRFYEGSMADLHRVVDYLQSHPRVDPARIGLVGYSLGGILGYSAANSDPRIGVLVTCVAPPLRDLQHPTAPHRNLQELSGTPVLLVAGSRDEFYSVDEVQWLFQLLPAQHKELQVYDGGHSPPAIYPELAASWFVRFLK